MYLFDINISLKLPKKREGNGIFDQTLIEKTLRVIILKRRLFKGFFINIPLQCVTSTHKDEFLSFTGLSTSHIHAFFSKKKKQTKVFLGRKTSIYPVSYLSIIRLSFLYFLKYAVSHVCLNINNIRYNHTRILLSKSFSM